MKTRKQCKKCPWRKDVDPNEIPNGYCQIKHSKLENTIAKPGDFQPSMMAGLRLMACHETPPGRELPCVGWLVHQFGVGNNIALRLAVMSKRVSMDVETVGEQHACFEDTLPRGSSDAGASRDRLVEETGVQRVERPQRRAAKGSKRAARAQRNR